MPQPDDSDKRSIFSRETLMPLGLVITLILCTAYIVRTVEDIKHRLVDVETDRYSMAQASEDALREAIANPGHKVPDPRNPGQFIVVEGDARITTTP